MVHVLVDKCVLHENNIFKRAGGEHIRNMAQPITQGTSTFIPTRIPGCQLWLDAADSTTFSFSSGSNISVWADKSSARNNATTSTGAGTVLNTSVGVSYSSGNMNTNLSASVDTETGFVIVNRTSGGGDSAILDTSIVQGRALIYSGSTITILRRGVTQYATATSPGNNIDILLSYDMSCKIWLYGTQAASSGAAIFTAGRTTTIANNYLNYTFTGNIKEIIVYNVILTNSQRQQVEGYLAWKWGFQGQLPQSHPFKTVAPFANIFPIGITPTPPVQISAGSFDPRQVGNCTLWMDASDLTTITFSSGSNVSTWRDKSASGLTATINTGTPTWSTAGVYSAANWKMQVTFFWPQRFTVFFVYTNGADWMSIGYGNTYMVWTGANPLMNNGSSQFDIGSGGGAQGYSFRFGTNIFTFGNTNLGNVLEPYAANGIMRGARVNTSAQSSFGQGTMTFPAQQQASATGVTLKELIFYNGGVQSAQARIVEGYLAWKWSLQSLLPTNHLFKFSPPVANMSPLTLALPGSIVPFYPNQLPGLVLWLDGQDPPTFTLATQSNITQWRDKSGFGNHTRQLNGAEFYGPSMNSNFFNMDSGGTSNNSLAGFVNINTTTLSGFIVGRMSGSTATSGRAFSLYPSLGADSNTTDATALFVRNVASNSVCSIRNATTVFGAVSLATNFLAESIYTGSSNFFYVNGALTGSNASSGTFNIARYAIGSEITNVVNNGLTPITGGAGFIGSIGEILLYNTALTNSERQQVEGYLAWKWGLQASLPASNVYQTSPPTSNGIVASNAVPIPLARVTFKGFAPTQIAGCQLWLDAADSTTFSFSSGSNISQWRDKSGNARNVTNSGTIPLITGPNSNAAVSLTGSPNYMTSASNVYPVNGLTQMSIFMVANNTTSQVVSDVNYPAIIWRETGDWGIVALATYQTGVCSRYGTGQPGSSVTYLFPSNQGTAYNLISSDKNGSTENIYVNGTIATTATGKLTTIANTGGTFLLGFYGIYYATNNICEIIVFNYQLSTPQRQQVEGYLAWKWGLQGSLPSSHPWVLFPPPPL